MINGQEKEHFKKERGVLEIENKLTCHTIYGCLKKIKLSYIIPFFVKVEP